MKTDKKQRFHLDAAPDGSLQIKAVAGHSAGVQVKPSLPKLHELPRLLVHGTRATCMPGITALGLDSRKREHIHFVDASDRTSVENQLLHGIYLYTVKDAQRSQYTYLSCREWSILGAGYNHAGIV